MSGREGKVIVADIDKLVETIENASITRDGKAILLAEAKRVRLSFNYSQSLQIIPVLCIYSNS